MTGRSDDGSFTFTHVVLIFACLVSSAYIGGTALHISWSVRSGNPVRGRTGRPSGSHHVRIMCANALFSVAWIVISVVRGVGAFGSDSCTATVEAVRQIGIQCPWVCIWIFRVMRVRQCLNQPRLSIKHMFCLVVSIFLPSVMSLVDDLVWNPSPCSLDSRAIGKIQAIYNIHLLYVLYGINLMSTLSEPFCVKNIVFYFASCCNGIIMLIGIMSVQSSEVAAHFLYPTMIILFVVWTFRMQLSGIRCLIHSDPFYDGVARDIVQRAATSSNGAFYSQLAQSDPDRKFNTPHVADEGRADQTVWRKEEAEVVFRLNGLVILGIESIQKLPIKRAYSDDSFETSEENTKSQLYRIEKLYEFVRAKRPNIVQLLVEMDELEDSLRRERSKLHVVQFETDAEKQSADTQLTNKYVGLLRSAYKKFMEQRAYNGTFVNPHYVLTEFTPKYRSELTRVWTPDCADIRPTMIIQIIVAEFTSTCIPAFIHHCMRLVDNITQFQNNDLEMSRGFASAFDSLSRDTSMYARLSRASMSVSQAMGIDGTAEHPSFSECTQDEYA